MPPLEKGFQLSDRSELNHSIGDLFECQAVISLNGALITQNRELRVEGEMEVSEAGAAALAARTVAWSGLQTYLGTVTLDACERPIRPQDGDSVRINVPGGSADGVPLAGRRPPVPRRRGGPAGRSVPSIRRGGGRGKGAGW